MHRPRQLITQRLAVTRRHQDQRALILQLMVDDRLLVGAEAVEAPDIVENLELIRLQRAQI